MGCNFGNVEFLNTCSKGKIKSTQVRFPDTEDIALIILINSDKTNRHYDHLTEFLHFVKNLFEILNYHTVLDRTQHLAFCEDTNIHRSFF